MNQLYFSKNKKEAKRLNKLYTQGVLQKIYHGIYTDDLLIPIEQIVQRSWMQVVSYIVTNGILSFRTAIDLKPLTYQKSETIVFVTSTYSKTISMPGLIIKVIKGNVTEAIEQVLPDLARSNLPRRLLENLSSVTKEYKGLKITGEEGVENLLAKELRMRGEQRLNQIRDEAKIIAQALNYTLQFKKLNKKISMLLATHQEPHSLKSPYAIAVAKNEPYDQNRLKLFENLFLYLKKCHFKDRAYTFSKSSFQNLSFFESYFSNFIEGTEFVIDEAEDIVFKRIEIKNRHADSHDILANYDLTNDFLEMSKTPRNEKEFIEIIKERHAYLMKERPDKHPGKFKTRTNKAGNTYFVDPKDVIGTLSQSFQLYQLLEVGILRALFIHFVVSEVHPFDDGNGRLSRIMMNAELVQAQQYKIIVPTVTRDNYLNGLRRATRDQDFLVYCKVMDQAQAYVQSINWTDYAQSREKFERDYADKTPDEGLPIFNRALRQLVLSEFAG